MPLPLPNLDTRRWTDLVTEGRALIPREAPTWSDHNVHDPGMTLLELLAWLTEQEIYRANRVPLRAYRKFLALADQMPEPPQPAHTVLVLTLRPQAAAVTLPAGLFFEVIDGPAGGIPFRATAPATIVPALLDTVQSFDGLRFADLSRAWREGRPILPWGSDPRSPSANQPDAGAALYLGFDEALPAGVPLSLWLEVAGAASSAATRAQLSAALAEAVEASRPQQPAAAAAPARRAAAGVLSPTRHHALSMAWEYNDGQSWQPVAEHQLEDTTRGLTLSGRVGLTLPTAAAASVVGSQPRPLHYLRCRLLTGMPDAAPVLSGLWLNAIPARQVRPVPLPQRRVIAAGCAPAADRTPQRGALGRLQLQPDAGAVTSLAFDADQRTPDTLVVDYQAATATAPGALTTIPITLPVMRAIAAGVRPQPAPVAGRRGRLACEPAVGPLTSLAFAEDAAAGDTLILDYQPATATSPGRLVTLAAAAAWTARGAGVPWQTVALPATAVAQGALQVWSLTASGAEAWQVQPDLDAADRTAAWVSLDAATGLVTCGDGEHGRVFTAGAALLMVYEATAGAGAMENLRPGGRWRLHRDFRAYHEGFLGSDLALIEGNLVVTNPLPAVDGANLETVEAAQGRAAARLSAHEQLVELSAASGATTLDQLDRAAVLALAEPARAVTLLDYERLALSVPGTRVARARAWANLDPAFPGLHAAGVVTVIIVPEHPRQRPSASPGLLAAVRQYLHQRRLVGTRLVVVGPDYLTVTVTAVVRAQRGAARAAVAAAIRAALDAFLHPLSGGPDGRGWPFGRDVYRAEILQTLDQSSGVDHVLALELRGDNGEPSCGNLCVGPTTLVVPGPHSITVEEANVYG